MKLYDILKVKERSVEPPVYRSIAQLLARAADEQSLLNPCRYDSDVYGDNDDDDYPSVELDQFDVIDHANDISHKYQSVNKLQKTRENQKSEVNELDPPPPGEQK